LSAAGSARSEKTVVPGKQALVYREVSNAENVQAECQSERNALAGRLTEAQQTMARLRQIDPLLRVSNLKEMTPLRRPEDRAKYDDGMRKAGLPE
jgi:hypothetical protein